MFKKKRLVALGLTLALAVLPAAGGAKKKDKSDAAIKEITAPSLSALWRNPADVTSRNLFYGPGGKEHAPHGAFAFIKEDLDGTNPKFVAQDQDGVKWKIKLGAEARPETAATRLVWAAGYYANEDYFLPEIRVANLPPHLRRGQKFVEPDGSIRNVRLKRYLKGEEKIGTWTWRDGPFAGTRELNALRVMMALINNWDLTDENNAIYEEKPDGSDRPVQIYMVSDLGSTFGTPGLTWPTRRARGNVRFYSHSEFIQDLTPDYVDFRAPRRDSLFFLATPHEYSEKLRLNWIGKHIPRADARWLGQLMAQFSPDQVRDAFRAAGYSPQEVEAFSTAVRARIAELATL